MIALIFLRTLILAGITDDTLINLIFVPEKTIVSPASRGVEFYRELCFSLSDLNV